MPDRVEIFEQHRPMLFGLAYRMLGTRSDAEDMVQETFLRWHKSSDIDVVSPKSYLSAILTRLCIDHMKSARVKREEYVGPWLPEPVIMNEAERDTKLAESLSLGFLVLMESLTPAERAVFLLREVFDFEYSEISQIVMKSEQNCRQLFARARKQLSARRPRFEPSPIEQQRLLNRFVQASSNGDMQGLLEVLKQDVVLTSDGGGKVRAALKPIRGAEKVSRFIFGVLKKRPTGFRSQFEAINGSPAIINYVYESLHSIVLPEFEGDRIRAIYIINNPDKLRSLAP